MSAPSFTLGIEEEYLLVDRKSRDLAHDRPEAFMTTIEAKLGEQVKPEFLTSQVELVTRPCADIAAARAELRHLRRTAAARRRIGLAIVRPRPILSPAARPRPRKIAQGAGARLQAWAGACYLACMALRLDDKALPSISVADRVSCAHPGVSTLASLAGEDTGVNLSHRVFDELPRTGIPEQFDSWANTSACSNPREDGDHRRASKLWWDVRPRRVPSSDAHTDVPRWSRTRLPAAALCCLCACVAIEALEPRWRRYAAMLIARTDGAPAFRHREGLSFRKGDRALRDLLGEIVEMVRGTPKPSARPKWRGARDLRRAPAHTAKEG